jgi:hypothetical protein
MAIMERFQRSDVGSIPSSRTYFEIEDLPYYEDYAATPLVLPVEETPHFDVWSWLIGLTTGILLTIIYLQVILR